MSTTPRRYEAVMLGDGSLMPISELIGRRRIREIEPLGREGKRLLSQGRVTLLCENGARRQTAPILQVLDQLRRRTLARRDACREVAAWTEHHDRILTSITRLERVLEPQRGS